MNRRSGFGKTLYVDFDAGMPPGLRKAVLATETCQRFLFERKRVGAFAEKVLAEGGRLSDALVLAESVKLNALVLELQAVIGCCRAGPAGALQA
jgi:hypothetical protein